MKKLIFVCALASFAFVGCKSGKTVEAPVAEETVATEEVAVTDTAACAETAVADTTAACAETAEPATK